METGLFPFSNNARPAEGPKGQTLSGILEFARLHPEMSSEGIARQMVASMNTYELRAFARGFIAEQIDGFRRSIVRSLESAAERNESEDLTSVAEAEREEKRELYFKWLKDHPEEKYSMTRRPERMEFKKWMGKRFDAWHKKAREIRVKGGNEQELEEFDIDWHPEGMYAYLEERRLERLTKFIRDYTERLSREIRLELTHKFLLAEFALGDGTSVTWGNATIKQHQARIRLLLGNSVGNAETAARHIAAVRMIKEAKANTLAEVSKSKNG